MEDQNDEKKEADAGDALEAFFVQFGEIDAHAEIVLEEFFRQIMEGN